MLGKLVPREHFCTQKYATTRGHFHLLNDCSIIKPMCSESIRNVEARRRRQLIDATIEAIADVGFAQASLGEIARRAGVSPGLVAHYFANKDGLLEATMRRLVRELGRSVRRGSRRTPVRAIASRR